MPLYFAPWQLEARVTGLLENKSGLTEAAHREVTLLLRNTWINFFLLFLIIRGKLSVIKHIKVLYFVWIRCFNSMYLPLHITTKLHMTLWSNNVSSGGSGFIKMIYTAKHFGYICYLLIVSSYGLSMFFIARKPVNSVLDPVWYLQIQDRTLVGPKPLNKNTSPSPFCSVDTQLHQEQSSHGTFL